MSHPYGWAWSQRACGQDLDGLMGGTDGPQHERGVERRHHGLPSLVLMATGQSAPVQSRLYRVTGQHAVPDGPAGVEGDAGQACRHRVADVLEVRGAAADDHAEAGHSVVVTG